MNITEFIIQTRNAFRETPQEINDGLCGDFSHILWENGYGEPYWGDELPDECWSELALTIPDLRSHFMGTHSFIQYHGKFYDSECPCGVEYADELPHYQRLL
jgi:hypothetical protein